MRRIALLVAGAALAATTGVATPAQAGCTTNYYRVVWNYSDVYEEPGWGYLKTKWYGDQVTGPNSNVEPNLQGSYRKVWTSSAWDGRGWMAAASLDYRYCT